MKKLLIASAMMAVSAQAQYAPSNTVVVTSDGGQRDLQSGEICRRNDQGYIVCQQISSAIAPAVAAPAQATGLRVWDTIAPQYPSNLPISESFCLKKKEWVLAKFAQGADSGNVNKMVESYYWKGRTEGQEIPIVDRLSQVAVSGQWQRSYVAQWSGSKRDMHKIPIYVRWVPAESSHPTLYFSLRNDQECWFLEMIDNPGETVLVRGAMSDPDGQVVGERDAPAPSETVEPPSVDQTDSPNSEKTQTNYVQVN